MGHDFPILIYVFDNLDFYFYFYYFALKGPVEWQLNTYSHQILWAVFTKEWYKCCLKSLRLSIAGQQLP